MLMRLVLMVGNRVRMLMRLVFVRVLMSLMHMLMPMFPSHVAVEPDYTHDGKPQENEQRDEARGTEPKISGVVLHGFASSAGPITSS